MTEHIERWDLDPVLAGHRGNQVFAEALRQAGDSQRLLRILGQYVLFNSRFGGGVANLAGEIAVRQDLFRDPDEPVGALADRSADVASHVFFAAIDEFDDRFTPYRDTHRTLAQAFLRATGGHFGFGPAELDETLGPAAATLAAMHRVEQGYGTRQSLDEEKLFGAMGFHLGSEILADEEFNILNGFLREAHPKLVAHLEATRVPIMGKAHAAYFWVHIHTSVEADHFASAVKGADAALRYYAGDAAPPAPKSWIVAGFQEFAHVQGDFMSSLGR